MVVVAVVVVVATVLVVTIVVVTVVVVTVVVVVVVVVAVVVVAVVVVAVLFAEETRFRGSQDSERRCGSQAGFALNATCVAPCAGQRSTMSSPRRVRTTTDGAAVRGAPSRVCPAGNGS